MALSSAILTGLTGIESNQFAVETIGANVANVNTTGYKSSRALFETLVFQTIEEGTRPDASQGGTNPVQVGFGSGVSAVQRSFEQGNVERTGVGSDLAIDGNGFFILDAPDGNRLYTRDGSFSLNTENTLVSTDGAVVQGFAANEDETIDSGTLTALQIPLGELASATATTEARLSGNLDAQSEPALIGSISTSNPMRTAGGSPATEATALTALVDENDAPLFNTGDVVTVRGVQKGGLDLPETQFIVGTDGSTYGDFARFLETSFGIESGTDGFASGGVSVSDETTGPAGALLIRANPGDVHAIGIDAASIRNETTGGAPFSFTTTPAAGQGATTSFIVFDSLGTPVDVRLRFVLESRTDSGNVWRFSAESVGSGSLETFGDGTVTFDQNGRFISADSNQITIDRAQAGATPLTLNLDFSSMTGLTASAGESAVVLDAQNGFPEGTLTGFEIDNQGLIKGTFSNGQSRTLGQVALATFANTAGLVALNNNNFAVGVSSGPANVLAPGTAAAGTINAAQLELSNVDLSRELIALITASTGFSAASRMVRTADDMLQEVLLLVR